MMFDTNRKLHIQGVKFISDFDDMWYTGWEISDFTTQKRPKWKSWKNM